MDFVWSCAATIFNYTRNLFWQVTSQRPARLVYRPMHMKPEDFARELQRGCSQLRHPPTPPPRALSLFDQISQTRRRLKSVKHKEMAPR